MAQSAFTQGQAAGADGWVDDTAETWTYVSATSFKVSGVDVSAKYTVGTRIKLTQTTVKYLVVAAVAFSTDTTVTVTGGSDYSLANAAISANFHSYAANPQGYPGWFTYDCGPTGFSGTPTQRSSRFSVQGRTCTVYIDVFGTSNSTSFTVNAPINYQRSFEAFAVSGEDNGSNPSSPTLAAFGSAPSTTITQYKTWSAAGWTNSGTKGCQFSAIYEI